MVTWCRYNRTNIETYGFSLDVMGNSLGFCSRDSKDQIVIGSIRQHYSVVKMYVFFPTCQVRVVRFYVSCLLLPRPPPPPLLLVLLLLLVVLLLVVLVVVLLVLLVQLRPAIHSVLCRTSTTTIHAQCSLPDLNHDQPRPVFPAGPQPRPSTPSVPCRTSTTTIHAQCSLPHLNREYPRPVFPAGPQPRPSTHSVPCRTSTASIHAKRYAT